MTFREFRRCPRLVPSFVCFVLPVLAVTAGIALPRVSCAADPSTADPSTASPSTASPSTASPSSANLSAADAETRRALAMVGPDTITVADLDAEVAATLSAAQGREIPKLDPDGVLKRLIQNRLFEQEGYRLGADQTADVQGQVKDLIRMQSLNALTDSITAPPPGMRMPSADSLLGRVNTIHRYSHILVQDEALAKAIRDSADQGVAFADLARRHSKDDTAASGGDLGWASEGAYVDEFEAAARPLHLHEIAGPVKTKFGWHLITLTDARSDTLKSAEMAQSLIASQERERRNAAMRRYLEELRGRYNVVVNEALLARLDYASEDPAVQKELQTSDSVLTVLPTGRLTVRGLTKNIRLKYFHGLNGRPEAPDVRNKMFNDWVTEGLLSYEAHRLRFDQRPEVLLEGKNEERRILRETVLTEVLNFPFKPADAEIQAYYDGHPKDFTPAARVKCRSVLITDEAAAKKFREQLDQGSGFKWLSDRTPEVANADAPVPADWIDPTIFGKPTEPIREGEAFGPLQVPDGWVVAQISAVETPAPAPLKECREKVIRAMRVDLTKKAISDAIARLESATTIDVRPDARDTIAERIAQWNRARPQGGRS